MCKLHAHILNLAMAALGMAILSSCSIISPSLSTDSKERICSRDGDGMEMKASEIAAGLSDDMIASVAWSIEGGKAYLEFIPLISVGGEYAVKLDFHEPLEAVSFSSSLGRLEKGFRERLRLGPMPYEFDKPCFAEVSIRLLRIGGDGRETMADEADSFFLKDTELVGDRALKGLDCGGMDAQSLLDMYCPLLKTDVDLNEESGVLYVDLPPKDIKAILSGPPENSESTERAMIKCDAWPDKLMAEDPSPAHLRLFDGRKDDFYIDLPQPFSGVRSPWRDLVSHYPNAIYGRAVRIPLVWKGRLYKDALVLQYWLPYYVNHLALLKVGLRGRSWLWNAGNYHEGEVENVSIALVPGAKGLEPLCAAYAKHFKGTAEPWDNVRKHAPGGEPGSHPVVYVANGSHASCFSPSPSETLCSNGSDVKFHSGGGYWYGMDDGDERLGPVKMLPSVDSLKDGDEYGFLLFTGRFGGSYIDGVVNKFNRSPYLFPYVLYPKFSLTGSWIAGSGVNRWIDPAGEIQYCAGIPSGLPCDFEGSVFSFETSGLKFRRAGGQIVLDGLDFKCANPSGSPARFIAFFYKDKGGALKRCALFECGKTPPTVSVPAADIGDGPLELVACDIIPPSKAKLPLDPAAHIDSYEWLRKASASIPMPAESAASK